MKLAASNIGWNLECNQAVYTRMRKNGFTGLEIAPTKFFPDTPYSEDNLLGARTLANVVHTAFGISIVSMQSIWYGRTESIWGSDADREALVVYTERAAAFAQATGCTNLVFGCPGNRNIPAEWLAKNDTAPADAFFRAAADAAASRGCVLALEPNPPIYRTNFLNTTAQAVEYLRKINHPALRLNLDVGTMIENREDVDVVAENLDLINHVHISRPGLLPAEGLALHRRLAKVLHTGGYTGWVSVEMKDAGLAAITHALEIVAREFDT